MSAVPAPKTDVPIARSGRRVRMLVTPDGVPLRVEIAELAERASAFAADFVITLIAAGLLLRLAMLVYWLLGGVAGEATVAALTFVAFVVRNAYFVCFEMAWGGMTPGKRAFGLRVVDRNGGGLSAAAVVARNLTREAETFFPLALLLQSESWLFSPWEILPVALWLLLTSVLPLCNRDRLRAGDLIAGTIVIAAPKKVLLPELVSDRRAFHFSGEQLQRYGILELQVLEDVLRRADAFGQEPLLLDIAERIARKIGWPKRIESRDAHTFLRDFYAAQREFLELRKHLGEERPDKYFRAGGRGGS